MAGIRPVPAGLLVPHRVHGRQIRSLEGGVGPEDEAHEGRGAHREQPIQSRQGNRDLILRTAVRIAQIRPELAAC